jgi:hypothetical protein
VCSSAAEEAKAEQLKKRISSSAGDAQLRQERLLKALNEKVGTHALSRLQHFTKHGHEIGQAC